MKKKFLALSMLLTFVLSSCGTQEVVVDEPIVDEIVEEPVVENTLPGNDVIIYFANWNAETKGEHGGTVASIPWDKVTYINHAFWSPVPADGSTTSSFDQRMTDEGPRTEFKVASFDEEADAKHFEEYEKYSAMYPDVNIMISMGGWSRSGYFSEMAYTAEGRTSFVDSCIDLMETYPWIDGIDIDWEYPGGSKDGERKPESDNDQGCPIYGSPAEDNTNFALLLEEMRTSFDEHFGQGAKKITACASASTGWTLPMQDWASFAPYLDKINIMTYDLAGLWDGVTGNASSFISAKSAAVYFKTLEIPMTQLVIGTPMYATTFLMQEITDNPLGAKIENYKPNTVDITEDQLMAWEAEAVSGYAINFENGKYVMGDEFDNGGAGWHMGYDKKKDAAYLYNDDAASEYYKWFISYENTLSLQKKLDYINESDVSGIIVWETSQDTADYKLITEMHDNLVR